jgi:2-polyprenyl-3-methyl-5-hydroxy-6-metoxy-1,4-benzoquinol methylase
MIGTSTIDPGMEMDWGKTSEDYAKYRPGPPISLYEKLKALGVGLPGQRVLDIGTGTGVIARQMARQECKVTATDISKEQVLMAQTLSKKENLEINFKDCPSEEISFEENSFDIITRTNVYS